MDNIRFHFFGFHFGCHSFNYLCSNFTMLNHNMKHVLMVQNTQPQIEFMFSRNLNTKGIPIGVSKPKDKIRIFKIFFFTEAQNFYCCRKSQYMDKKTQGVIVHELWTNYVQIMDNYVQKIDIFVQTVMINVS